ncbi:hypothetical protein OF83DRAFT_617520 [Amylostereum chailletii]|nr:hypothetical protein OF83DRAFT_617520 [Amylostereum chailletii]
MPRFSSSASNSLAQLVKSVKKRSFTDPLSPDALEHSLEQAEQFEQEVKTWLSDLPRPFRLDADIDGTNTARFPISATLQAQRCELAIVANRIILKIFLPFLKTCSEEGSDVMTPRRVVSSVVDAAHAVIHSVRLTHSVWRQTRPAAFAFYSFGRTLFDAVVMSASAVIVHPTGISSGVALADLNTGLSLMKDTRTAFARSCKESCSGGTVDEAVRIVEMLKEKAEAIRSGQMAGPVSAYAGMKRKREDEDDFTFEGDFQLPFVGAGVTCARPGGAKEHSPIPEVPRPSTATGNKRGKLEGSMASDVSADSVSPPSQDLPPQVPTRGRPRGSSSARHRLPPPSVNGKPQPQVQSQASQPAPSTRSEASTPPPEPASYSSLPELLLSDLPNPQPQMKYAPFGSEGPSSAGMYDPPQQAMAQPQMTHYPPMSAMAPPPQGQHSGSLYSSIPGPSSAHSTPPYAPPSHHSSPYGQEYYPIQSYGQPPSTPYETSVGLPPDAHVRHSSVAPGPPSGQPPDEHNYMMGGKAHPEWPQNLSLPANESWGDYPKYY